MGWKKGKERESIPSLNVVSHYKRGRVSVRKEGYLENRRRRTPEIDWVLTSKVKHSLLQRTSSSIN